MEPKFFEDLSICELFFRNIETLVVAACGSLASVSNYVLTSEDYRKFEIRKSRIHGWSIVRFSEVSILTISSFA